ARDLEGAARRGGGRGAGVGGREIEHEPRADALRQGDRHGPLDHVPKREARAEGVRVEHRAAARRRAGVGRALLRGERRRRDERRDQTPRHGGRLKMIVMPFTTETIEGTPSASAVRSRPRTLVPEVAPPTAATASPSAGTMSRPAAASRAFAAPPAG